MNPIRLTANVLWFGSNAAEAAAYHRALARCDEVQNRVLQRYLTRNRETLFGHRHSFAKLRSPGDFRQAVPLTRYDDYRPYVEKIAAGEQSVLTADRVTHFALSSGSASAAKRIPYTRSLQAEFRRAIAPWVWNIVRQQPSQLCGSAYWSVTPALREREATNVEIPVGFEEDSAYLGHFTKRLVDAVLAVPGGVGRLQDTEAFKRVTLLCLLGRADLSLISIWHPSFLLLLLDWMVDHWDDLLADLAEGLRFERLAIRIPPQPKRAGRLAAIGPADLTSIWPDLALISCWGEGHAQNHLAALAEHFPGVEIQPKGLIATEAFVSLPLVDRRPLALRSHYFEFLTPGGEVRSAAQLDEGGTYSLVVTTGGGFYRYCLDDRVEVTGFLGSTPCLRFLGKEDDVSDLCGEKLSEAFVGGVIREVLAAHRIRPDFAMLVPEVGTRCSGYLLLLETADEIPGSLAASLERGLCTNPHYDYCIRLGQLRPAVVRRVPGKAYETFARHLMAKNQRLGNIKPRALGASPDWSELFGQAEEVH